MPGIQQSSYVIIGAGIHGLSSAYHLALELKSRGKGSGADILVLDKTGIGAGASGIACGVIRNNYFQSAMRELMAHSVSVWESDPEVYSYHPVGYMQISSESMREDVASIYQQQQAIGYESIFIEGRNECREYMLNIFHDWQAQGITSVLHEKAGGYANNSRALEGLAAKAEAEGVRIVGGVAVTGFDRDNAGAVTAVQTEHGNIDCGYLIIAPGPWAKQFWDMLELPSNISVRNPDSGAIATAIPMWVYWSLQEGTLGVDPRLQTTNDGKMPPVIHVDTDAPLLSDIDGSLITDKMWGIYYKPDFHFDGVQGGAAPFIINKPAGIVIHPGAGNYDNTIVNALMNYCGGNLSNIGDELRPGIVHRIDKDTSGLIVIAKNNFAHENLSIQFSKHSIKRVYQLLIWGKLRPQTGIIKTLIKRSTKNRQLMEVGSTKGKVAITNYKTLEVFENNKTPTLSLVECKLETGRTHQIRVHLSSIGHPVAGDELYGGGVSGISRQFLHSTLLAFIHPASGKKVEYRSPLASDLECFLNSLV